MESHKLSEIASKLLSMTTSINDIVLAIRKLKKVKNRKTTEQTLSVVHNQLLKALQELSVN